MLMLIREAWAVESHVLDSGPVESDEFYVRGLGRNMGTKRCNGLGGHGDESKTAVAGLKGRATYHVTAKVVRSTNEETLQQFEIQRTEPETMVYTDDS